MCLLVSFFVWGYLKCQSEDRDIHHGFDGCIMISLKNVMVPGKKTFEIGREKYLTFHSEGLINAVLCTMVSIGESSGSVCRPSFLF